MPPKKETKWNITRISTTVGILTGLIVIFTFAGKYIVTDAELQRAEDRIILKVESEALIIRQVYIDELLAQKTRLESRLGKAESDIQFSNIRFKIDAIDKRIDKLRGKR